MDLQLFWYVTLGVLLIGYAWAHALAEMPRATALVTNFFGQWLWARNMDVVKPDPTVFPDFDESLRALAPFGRLVAYGQASRQAPTPVTRIVDFSAMTHHLPEG